MPSVFVIRNLDGHYLTKRNELWLDGSEPQYIFKTEHEDIALNTLIEVNSKNIELRADIISVDANQKGIPSLEISEIESKMPVKTKVANEELESDNPDDNHNNEESLETSAPEVST